MKKHNAALIVLIFALIFALASCGSGREPLQIEPPDFPFSVSGSISSGDAEFEGTITLASADAVSLEAVSPAGLAGFRWELSGEGCTLSHSGVTAPLALPPPALSMLAEALTAGGDSLVSAELAELGGQSYTRALYGGERGEIVIYYAPPSAGESGGAPVRIEYGDVVMNIIG